jgi:hypothetical protein
LALAPARRRLLAAAWCAIALGVGFRVLASAQMDIWEDGVEYVEMGRAWSRWHEFFLPDSERMGRELRWGPGYSQHFPPAFPFALGLIFSAIGVGVAQAKAALVAVSLAALGAVYATTRNLLGADRAALVTGLVALDPSLVWVTGIGLSENFSLLFATLTVWAFLKSLSDLRWILPAGLCWTVVYLTRASAGAFGLVPAAAGAAWWLRFRGWRALFSPWCVAAGTIFVSAALLWAWRNFSLFGAFETSAYVKAAYDYGWGHPALVGRALLGKGAFFGVLLLAYAAPFWPELRASLRRLREAETSLLWLFVLVIWGLAWLVTSTFWPYEPRPFFSLDHHRYVLIGVVPLLWLALREAEPVGAVLRRWALLAAALLLASGTVLLSPVRESSARAAEFVEPYVREGDTLIVSGSILKYDIDLHFSRSDRITIRTKPGGPLPAFAFLGDMPPEPMPPGYALVGKFEQLQRGRAPSTTWVIAQKHVIQERGVPTNVTRSWD